MIPTKSPISGRDPARPEVRVLVADDHALVRRGLRDLLESGGGGGWSVCGEAASGAEAILKAKKLKPSVIVMDISMPEVNGLEATRQLRRELPNIPIVILTMHESYQTVREVLDAGAQGYVLKSDLDLNLIVAIETVVRGGTFFSTKVTQVFMDGYRNAPPRATEDGKSPLPRLTPRQQEVVRLLAEGKTNKEVAVALGISVKTAETHRTQIMHKLGLQSFSELVKYAVREKMVEV